MLIGWDDSKQAWLVKNSWGTGWGEGGYAWIHYGANDIGRTGTWWAAAPAKPLLRLPPIVLQEAVKLRKLTLQAMP